MSEPTKESKQPIAVSDSKGRIAVLYVAKRDADIVWDMSAEGDLLVIGSREKVKGELVRRLKESRTQIRRLQRNMRERRKEVMP